MKTLKKVLTLAFSFSLVLMLFTACATKKVEATSIPMNKISVEEAHSFLGNADYTFVDTRKASDYAEYHIEGAIGNDMEQAATSGDINVAKELTRDLAASHSENLILICYTGNKYAQVTTDGLNANGYDMGKVFTLEGGQKAWEEKYPKKAPEPVAQVLDASFNGTEVNEGIVTTEVDMSGYEKGKVVKVWIPISQTDAHQEIGEVVFEAEGSTDAKITTDALGNKMLYVEWGADVEPSTRKASVSFDAKRYNIVRPELVESGSIPAELNKYLTASGTVPITGAVKAKAEEITQGETTILGKTRAIYDWIVANMNRDNEVRGCGTGDVERLLTVLSGKCTDINSVFIGFTRALGIPSREMFGVRINADNITGNQHCWAEFYLPGTGWVAADPADVLKAVLTNKWDKKQQETLDLQEFYFGSNDNQRIKLTDGRDITLNPKQSGPALNNFGYPYAEVDTEILDCWDPKTFVYTISFKKGEKLSKN